jgi:Cu+-exporting ATPase
MTQRTTDTAPADRTRSVSEDLELTIGGMTCASCAARIEKKLNKVEGVTASVNYATEKAKVTYTGEVTPEDLVAVVEATGYTAALPAPEPEPGREDVASTDEQHSREDEAARWWQRLVISAVLSLPVLAMSMVPALQFDNWQWISLTLASPVVVWGAYPFHRAAVSNARHGAATMDTLISVGVTAAYLWSLWALLFTHAGMTGMRMPFQLLPGDSGEAHIYLEVAAAVTTFILAGRYFEARALRLYPLWRGLSHLRSRLRQGAGHGMRGQALWRKGPRGQALSGVSGVGLARQTLRSGHVLCGRPRRCRLRDACDAQPLLCRDHPDPDPIDASGGFCRGATPRQSVFSAAHHRDETRKLTPLPGSVKVYAPTAVRTALAWLHK